jgi:hypothetical protein
MRKLTIEPMGAGCVRAIRDRGPGTIRAGPNFISLSPQ